MIYQVVVLSILDADSQLISAKKKYLNTERSNQTTSFDVTVGVISSKNKVWAPSGTH